jgi:HEAT repeat protein
MADQRGVPDLTRLTESPEQYSAMHAQAIRDGDFQARVTATWGLIAQGGRSVPVLVAMLGSSRPEDREDAAGCLSWMGKTGPAIAANLIDAFSSERDQVARDTMLLALGSLGDKAAIPTLARVIRDHAQDGDTRWTAVEALGRLVRRRFDRQPNPLEAAEAWLDSHKY